MDGDDVGLLDDRVDVDQGDAVEGGLLGGDERVVADDVHLQAAGPVGHGLADLAQADDAQRPAAQLDAGEGAALPLAPAHRGVGGGGLVGQREHQGDRLLGRRDGVAGRGVDDHDAGLGGGLEVDVVDADAGPADDDQAGGVGEDVGRDLDLAANQQRVVVADDRGELFGRQPDLLVDFVVGAEDLEALLGQGLGNEDLHVGLPTWPGRGT